MVSDVVIQHHMNEMKTEERHYMGGILATTNAWDLWEELQNMYICVYVSMAVSDSLQ